MVSVRTCRACGCSELKACAGGCSWLSADRCSACPDAELTHPINPGHLQAATWSCVAGGDFGDGRVFTDQAAEYPQMVRRVTYRTGQLPEGQLFIGALEVEWIDWQRAADLLNESAAPQ